MTQFGLHCVDRGRRRRWCECYVPWKGGDMLMGVEVSAGLGSRVDIDNIGTNRGAPEVECNT